MGVCGVRVRSSPLRPNGAQGQAARIGRGGPRAPPAVAVLACLLAWLGGERNGAALLALPSLEREPGSGKSGGGGG